MFGLMHSAPQESLIATSRNRPTNHNIPTGLYFAIVQSPEVAFFIVTFFFSRAVVWNE